MIHSDVRHQTSLNALWFATGILLISFCKPTKAALVDINFSTKLLFDTSQQVAAGGITSGTILTDLFGSSIGSAGSLPVSGTLTYESNTSVFEQTNFGAGQVAAYFLPITAISMNVGGTAIQADISLINGNSATGFPIGANNGTFCSGTIACNQTSGLNKTIMSNGSIIFDNAPFTIVGPNGNVEFTARDALGFLAGETDASPEFAPAFNTSNVGAIFIDFFSLTLTGIPGTNLFPDTSLPDDNSFLTPNLIENIIVGITFDGDQITTPFTGSGTASPVPIPAALPLFSSALIFGTVIGKRRHTKIASAYGT